MGTTLKPRTTTVVIYQGDDMDTMADLRRVADHAVRVAEQSKGAPKRIGDDVAGEAKAAMDAYDAFVDEAAERALTVEMHSIGRRRFRDLMNQHLPRKVTVQQDIDPADPAAGTKGVEETHPDDQSYEVNTETFPPALLTFVDVDDPTIRTIAAPHFEGRKAITDFLDDEISDGDFSGMWVAAYYLNRMPSSDPKASRFSTGSRSITET